MSKRDKKVTAEEAEKTVKERFGKEFAKVISKMPDEPLIKMGQQSKMQEPVVENFYKTHNKRYYRNRPALEEAIKKIWKKGSARDREKFIEILEEYHDNKKPWWKFW